mmetsp:Transcript_14101/g.42194  ORF Transcript_14101/g.42194 Transcript_14101/m.42194 type:complete len:309 (-) Transcript_14101:2461-3387(-)
MKKLGDGLDQCPLRRLGAAVQVVVHNGGLLEAEGDGRALVAILHAVIEGNCPRHEQEHHTSLAVGQLDTEVPRERQLAGDHAHDDAAEDGEEEHAAALRGVDVHEEELVLVHDVRHEEVEEADDAHERAHHLEAEADDDGHERRGEDPAVGRGARVVPQHRLALALLLGPPTRTQEVRNKNVKSAQLPGETLHGLDDDEAHKVRRLPRQRVREDGHDLLRVLEDVRQRVQHRAGRHRDVHERQLHVEVALKDGRLDLYLALEVLVGVGREQEDERRELHDAERGEGRQVGRQCLEPPVVLVLLETGDG